MMRSVAKCAFQIACDEAVIRKNPCDFKLSSVIANDAKRRVALTREMCDEFSRFLRNDNIYRKYYDIVVVLLGTGMRISELCGLTINDLDFSKRRIRVERQLIRRAKKNADKPAYIEKPKSNSGFRFIPMSDEVYDSLRKTVERRSKLDDEAEIDGCRGFVFTNKRSAPYYAGVLQVAIKNASTKYVSRHPGTEMPIITPHVLRHTFCTNMVQRGLDIKSLQYIMGHSDTSTTLNVYAHAQYDHVAESFERIMNP